MRREGNIIKEIVEYSNMAEAFDTVLHGTARKRSRVGRYLMEHREDVIKELSESIMNGIPEEIDFHERIIVEGVKPRRIQVISMKSRIKASAVMNVVDKHIKKRFIRTTSASIRTVVCTIFLIISAGICRKTRKGLCIVTNLTSLNFMRVSARTE